VATAADNFQRADANPMSGSWGIPTSVPQLQIISHNVAVNATSQNSAEYYNGATFGNDQFSQAVVVTLATSGQPGPGVVVRLSASAMTGYVARVQTGAGAGIYLDKIVANVTTNLFTASGATFNAGDTLKITAIGTLISVYRNGVLVNSATDASIASGQPGIFIWSGSSASGTVTNWAGGDATPIGTGTSSRTGSFNTGPTQIDSPRTSGLKAIRPWTGTSGIRISK
jgi:hypothetical protein